MNKKWIEHFENLCHLDHNTEEWDIYFTNNDLDDLSDEEMYEFNKQYSEYYIEFLERNRKIQDKKESE